MHGLINRSIQCFVTDTYGAGVWQKVVQTSDIEICDFEAMLTYEDRLTEAVLDGLTQYLDTSLETVLEDLGTYLVSHPNSESLRRLMRFGGVTFEEFLHSLEDLPDRARLAVSDLMLPQLSVETLGDGRFELRCRASRWGFGHVLMGLLRGLADDYGALVFLEYRGRDDGVEVISISLLEAEYSAGRSFDLAGGMG